MIRIQKETREEIIQMVRAATNQRVRPRDLARSLSHKQQISLSEVRQALKDLIREGELVFTYRDPCSFVEFPAEKGARA